MKITSHVLDTAAGHPAAGVSVELAVHEPDGAWRQLAGASTDDDGRVGSLVPQDWVPRAGTYKVSFHTGAYAENKGQETFYPVAEITFEVRDVTQHYHIPLLLSPYGYTTYRGS